MDKFERFDKFEKLDRKVEETIREVETMDRRKFYRNSFVCAGVWALLLNLVIETLGRWESLADCPLWCTARWSFYITP